MLVRVGSRGSRLALAQASLAAAELRAPGLELALIPITTAGDRDRTRPFGEIGARGVFVKELEEALLEGRIDVAVHSAKDMTSRDADGLVVGAYLVRDDPRDALCGAAELGPGMRVGTASVRRRAQLLALEPELRVEPLRGNVDTRLRKLDGGDYHAIILASAGLRRLGLEHRISAAIPTTEMLPAVGQGALGIEIRAADAETEALVVQLDHAPTRAACTAERTLLRTLGGGCQVPIAAHAVVADGRMHLSGLVAGLSGDMVIRDAVEGEANDAISLGRALAGRLRELGAVSLLSGPVN